MDLLYIDRRAKNFTPGTALNGCNVVPVPVHGSTDIRKGLLNEMEKQTGVPSGFFVRFIDIPEAITQGETIEECLFNAAEVLSLIQGDLLNVPGT